MDLDLDIVRTRGRASKAVSAIAGEPLTVADLALLSEERGVKPPPLTRIRDSHHKLAQVLASGAKPAEASLATGYSLSRISILQADPAFQDLIEVYRQGVREEFNDLVGKMKSVASSALDEIQERLETAPEEMSTGTLLEIHKTLADRAGFGPASKSTNVNVNVDLAGRLESARRRLASTTIDVTPNEPGLLGPGPGSEESIA